MPLNIRFLMLTMKFLYFLVVLVHSQTTVSQDNLLTKSILSMEHRKTTTKVIASCINDITRTQFVSASVTNRIISVSYSRTSWMKMGELIDHLIKVLNEEAVTRNFMLMIRTDAKTASKAFSKVAQSKNTYQYYIIIATDYQDLDDIFGGSVINDFPFNPDAQFIVFMHQDNVTRDDSEESLVLLKKKLVIKSILVTIDKDNRLIQRIWRLQPMGYSKECGQNYHIFRLATHCTNGTISNRYTKLFYDDKLLESEQKSNMKGCQVSVIANTWIPYVINVSGRHGSKKGIEIMLLDDIASYLNITFVYTQRDDGWGVQVNDTWTGLLQNITDGQFKIGVGNVHFDDAFAEFFELSKWYYFEDILWYVPANFNKKPQWIRFIQLFSYQLWLAIASSIILFAIIITFWSALLKKDKPLHRFGESIMNTLPMFAGLPTPHQPKSSIIRATFVCGSVLGLHISTLYNTGLLTILTQPVYENQISSEKELKNSGLWLTGPAAFREFFNNSDDVVLLNRYVVNGSDKPLPFYLNLTKHGRYATIANQLYVEYLLDHYDSSVVNVSRKGSVFSAVHALDKEPIAFYPLSIVAKRGYALMPHFNRIISQYVACGITNKWLEMEKYKIRVRLPQRRSNLQEDVTRLDLSNMKGPFNLFMAGCNVGLWVFLLEVMIRRFWE